MTESIDSMTRRDWPMRMPCRRPGLMATRGAQQLVPRPQALLLRLRHLVPGKYHGFDGAGRLLQQSHHHCNATVPDHGGRCV